MRYKVVMDEEHGWKQSFWDGLGRGLVYGALVGSGVYVTSVVVTEYRGDDAGFITLMVMMCAVMVASLVMLVRSYLALRRLRRVSRRETPFEKRLAEQRQDPEFEKRYREVLASLQSSGRVTKDES